MPEKISYAKTIYGKDEIDAVVDCLNGINPNGKKFKAI